MIYDLVHMGIVLFPFFSNFSIQFNCLILRKTYLLIYTLCVSSCARDVVQEKLEAVLANIRLGCKLYPVQDHHNNKSCVHNLVQETVEFVPTNARHGCKQCPVQGYLNYKSVTPNMVRALQSCAFYVVQELQKNDYCIIADTCPINIRVEYRPAFLVVWSSTQIPKRQ